MTHFRTLFAASLILAGTAVAAIATADTAQAGGGRSHCRSIIRATVEGYYNITRAEAAHCAQLGIYIEGSGHRTDATVTGKNRTALSQLGRKTKIRTQSHGNEHDTGIVAADGARVDHAADGFDNDSAIYARNNSKVVARTNGWKNRLVIKSR